MNGLPRNLKRKVTSFVGGSAKNMAALAQTSKNWRDVVTGAKEYKLAKAEATARKNAERLENQGELLKSAKRYMNLDIVTALRNEDPNAVLKRWQKTVRPSYARPTDSRKRKIAKAALKNKKRNSLDAALAKMKLV